MPPQGPSSERGGGEMACIGSAGAGRGCERVLSANSDVDFCQLFVN
jgi:hypothetical protein